MVQEYLDDEEEGAKWGFLFYCVGESRLFEGGVGQWMLSCLKYHAVGLFRLGRGSDLTAGKKSPSFFPSFFLVRAGCHKNSDGTGAKRMLH